jgi:hypothetical protein
MIESNDMESEIEAKALPNGLIKDIPDGLNLNTLRAHPVTDSENKENPDQYRIRLSDDIEEPEPLLAIQEGTILQRICSIGDISTIKGKAKSRKSFFATLLIAAILHMDLLYQNVSRHEKAKGVLWIDTEQSHFHLQKAMKRIPRMIGHEPKNLYVFALRRAETQTRLQQLEEQILRFKDDVSFVLVDGFADLIYDINDRAECIQVVNKAMQWTTDHAIHICFILHENKVGTDARGHAGTELTNKSETVFRVKKDPDDPKYCSIVEGEYTRGMGFDPFTFSINSEGLPQVLNPEVVQFEQKKRKPTTPDIFDDKEHMKALKDAFQIDTEYTRLDTISRVKLAWKIGEKKAIDFLNWYLLHEFIEKSGNDRSPKQRYKFIGHLKNYNTWDFQEL